MSKIYDNVTSFLPDRPKDKKIVWTNGCFDLLHEGHKYSVNSAAALGDYLIVGLNSDSSVRQLKGVERPIQSQNERAQILAEIAEVNAVIIFEGLTPIEELKLIQPDVYAKGADYDIATLAEAQYVSSYGGQIITLPLLEGYSTTQEIKNRK